MRGARRLALAALAALAAGPAPPLRAEAAVPPGVECARADHGDDGGDDDEEPGALCGPAAAEALGSLAGSSSTRVEVKTPAENGAYVLASTAFELEIPEALEDAEVCVQVISVQYAPTPPSCMPAKDAAVIKAANLPYGEHDLVVWARDRPGSGTLRTFVATTELPATGPQTARGRGPRCELEGPRLRKEAAAAAASAGPGHARGGIALLALVNRGGPSFREASASWAESGLLDAVNHRVVFLQKWAHAPATVGDAVPHTAAQDARVEDLPAAYRFEVIGAKEQLGIGPALNALMETAAQLGAEHAVFVEEDFRVHELAAGRATATLEKARELLRAGDADVVKLRHREKPGEPFFPWIWKTREEEITRLETPYGSNHSLLETVHWLADPPSYFGGSHADLLWRCGNSSQTAWHEAWFCAHSTHSAWSNNPFVLTPGFYRAFIHETAARDWTRTIEGALAHSPHLWDERCFVLAQGPGIFTHNDIDGRPLAAQSPSENPFDERVRARYSCRDALRRATSETPTWTRKVAEEA